ncbi:MAG: hypothetical protein ABI776_03775 [Nocardioidaceae bacterium]
MRGRAPIRGKDLQLEVVDMQLHAVSWAPAERCDTDVPIDLNRSGVTP